MKDMALACLQEIMSGLDNVLNIVPETNGPEQIMDRFIGMQNTPTNRAAIQAAANAYGRERYGLNNFYNVRIHPDVVQ